MVTQATITDRDGKTAQVDARIVQRAIGKKGVSMWGGFVREEYLTQLADWSRQAKLFIEMRDDPTVGALLNAIKLPLLKADVGVAAASDSSADVKAAQFLRDNMDGMYRQTWRSYVEEDTSV